VVGSGSNRVVVVVGAVVVVVVVAGAAVGRGEGVRGSEVTLDGLVVVWIDRGSVPDHQALRPK
jgi:hypothetical protein